MSLPISGTDILPKQLNAGHMAPFTRSIAPSTPNTLLGVVSGLFIVDVPNGTTDQTDGPVFQPTNDIFITDVWMRDVGASGITGSVTLYKLPLTGFAFATQITVLAFSTHAIGEVVRATQIGSSLIKGFTSGDRILAFGTMNHAGAEVFIEFNNYLFVP